MNLHEVTNYFKKRLLDDEGIKIVGDLEANVGIQRFHIEGDKAGSKNAACNFHYDDNPTLWVQNHKTGRSITLRVTGTGKSTKQNKVDAQLIKQQKQQRQHEQKLKQDKAANTARYLWRKFVPAIEHAYLSNKQIKVHGLRIDKSNNLVIPLFNANRELVNLQFISNTGDKRFLSGGRKKDCFSWIGKPTLTVIIAEGFATAATLHEQTGNLVFIAFDAGNLKPVAINVRRFYPESNLVIAADNDDSGVGETKAKEAALAVNALISMPPTVGHDWNDHYNAQKVSVC